MLLWFLSCTGHPCAPGELYADGVCHGSEGDPDRPTDDSGQVVDSDDTGEAPEWTSLPESCEAPADLPSDPLVWTGYDKKGQDQPGQGRFAEWVDLELDGTTAYAVGQGGLGLYDISDPAEPIFIDWFPSGDMFYRYHRVELLSDDVVALSHRDNGLTLAQWQDGTLEELTELTVSGLEGLAWVEPYLYATVRGEGLRVYDLSDPGEPSLHTTVAGPETTWDLSDVVDGWTYAADNAGGIYPIDLSDPASPVVHDPVDVQGATLHIEATTDHLYVSTGGYGVRIYERSDPAAPTEVAQVETGGSAVMSDVADDRLWISDHTGVALFDVSDPANPTWLAREVTEQFALAIDADAEVGWVGDWNYLSSFTFTGDEAGELSMADEEITLPADGGTADTVLTNRGNATLELAGATVDGEVEVLVGRTTLEPGESTRLRLRYLGSDEAWSGLLCVASTDPDGPTQETPLVVGEDGASYLGKTATDFTLRDLEGNSYTLSEHLGKPVVFAYFATW